MSDNHPLNNKPASGHPLSDAPPPQEKRAQGVPIPIPMGAQKPILTYAIIAVNVALFALRYVLPDVSNAVLIGGFASTELILDGRQYYRLFTSMFLHLNEIHIAFNSLALYYIGANVERLFGHVRFGLIYLLGGLLGSILPLFVSVGGLGASGAVFAVWGAEAVFLYQHRQLFGAAGRARLRSSMIFMLMNFFLGFTFNAASSGTENSVSIGNVAHLGGLLGGVILTWFIGPKLVAKRVDSPQVGQAPVKIVEVNPLDKHIPTLLYFGCTLLALILLANFIRS